MKVVQLLESLINSINDGTIDKDGEILACTVNGCFQADEEQLMETVNENLCDGLYLLMSKPNENCNIILYPHVRETKEETQE